MKKCIYILMFTVPLFCFSQSSSFGFSAGLTTNGFGGHASYNYRFSEKDYLQTSILGAKSIDKSSEIDVPYNTIAVNMGYFKNVITDKYNRYYISLGGGGSVGYEILNNGNTVLENGAIIQGNNSIVYGGFIGSEPTFFLNDELAIITVLNYFIYTNSDLGNTSFYAGI
ncbi:conjugal transfer protein TraO, partial [Streptomyces diastaticus]|uniref:conjugal transfer protein TraO n=1 Tax=Streptomyces diastaticus TaxID=1956 RepID=UPI0037D5E93F